MTGPASRRATVRCVRPALRSLITRSRGCPYPDARQWIAVCLHQIRGGYSAAGGEGSSRWLVRFEVCHETSRTDQVASAEALGEFGVSRGQQVMGRGGTSVTLPQGRETHGGAKFPRQCRLLACDFQSAQQLGFGGRAGI